MVTKMKKCLFIALLLLAPTAWSANTGEKSPASSAQEASPTTAWTNIDSVFASDNQRSIYTGTAADTLYITNFSMGVTAGATIDSIFWTVEGQGSASQAGRRVVKGFLVKDGVTTVGELSGKFQLSQGTDATARVTGSTTPLWNTTWTAAEVNATTFGVAFWKTASQAGDILIDHVTLYVAFTESGGAKGTIMRTIISD